MIFSLNYRHIFVHGLSIFLCWVLMEVLVFQSIFEATHSRRLRGKTIYYAIFNTSTFTVVGRISE